MGYTTDFSGEWHIVPPLTDEHRRHLFQFAEQPHSEPDAPSSYCQWVPSDDGTTLQWDEGEKFYSYIEWLRYLVDRFFNPWGYSLAGVVSWQGEENGDVGRIKIESPSNEVLVSTGSLIYGAWE